MMIPVMVCIVFMCLIIAIDSPSLMPAICLLVCAGWIVLLLTIANIKKKIIAPVQPKPKVDIRYLTLNPNTWNGGEELGKGREEIEKTDTSGKRDNI